MANSSVTAARQRYQPHYCGPKISSAVVGAVDLRAPGPSGIAADVLKFAPLETTRLFDPLVVEASLNLNVPLQWEGGDVAMLRKRIGMVFQQPNPFPKSIYENVAYGLRIHGERSKSVLDGRVEWALRNAALWDEVKDRLGDGALSLSGGQQQRLVIARAIAIEPSVLLLDEPASALDPISTLKIEELINQLKDQYTIIIVTHNMQQAARVSDHTAFLYLGELIEFSDTDSIFRNPQKQQTEDYITGRYG